MRKQGFSLVELSIVLVILGLLVGGILAGKSLIRASELRSIGTDFQKYNTAIFAFRDKYFGLPGDLTNATLIWGKDTTTAAACAGQSGTAASPGTCNGNGNGVISNGSSIEWYRFWQHLSLSGLIEGQYLGIGNAWSYAAVPGVDVPASKISNAGYSVMTAGQQSISEFGYSFLPDNTYLWLVFGGATTGYTSGYILTNEEAWNVDTKMDDGLPYSGKIHAGHQSNCSNFTLNPTPPYGLTNKALNQCNLAYIIQ